MGRAMRWDRIPRRIVARPEILNPVPPQKKLRQFTAKYPGICWACRRKYPKGTLIREVSGRSRAYRHMKC